MNHLASYSKEQYSKKTNTMVCLFMLGLFSQTQINVVGSIGISELVCFVIAPVMFIQDAQLLRKDGFMTIIKLVFLALLGCLIASFVNHTSFPRVLRGIAGIYSIFALVVVLHRWLRKDLGGLRWFLFGCCISNIINIFVFQKAVEVSSVWGGEANEKISAVTGGVLFWLGHIAPLIVLPVQGWYLKTPLLYSIIACLAMPVFTFSTTDTGRSATLIGLMTVAMIISGRKSYFAMRNIQKHIFFYILAALVLLLMIKSGYVYMAENGYLNERATLKYEGQMKKGAKEDKKLIGILMGGRSDFFASLYCIMKKPLVGYGPWAIDFEGANTDFFLKYGNEEDIDKYIRSRYANQSKGKYGLIPAHSHILGWWVLYGVLGLVFWLYVFYLMYKLVRYNLSIIPQWFGYFSLEIFNSTWSILFSPYGDRVSMSLFFTMMLFVDAVRRGKVSLPLDMQRDIQKHCLLRR